MFDLLLVEDDLYLAKTIEKSLVENGWGVTSRSCGAEGLAAALHHDYSAIILDRNLPKVDGMTILRRLRGANSTVPVLFVSNMSSLEDRVEGLEAGADYLVKPFATEELVARVKRLCQNSQNYILTRTVRFSNLELDRYSRSVFCREKEISMTSREFKLLEFLIEHKNSVVTKRMLLESVWGIRFEPKSSVVQTQISRLKSKLKTADERVTIVTQGGGYMLTESH